MREQRSDRGDLFEQMHEFVTARINDDLTPEQFARFDALLSENEAARRLYVQYIYETLALPALLGEVEPAAPPFGSFAEDVTLNDSASDQIENNQVSPAAPACADEAPPCIIVRQTADSQPFVGGPVFSYMVASVFMCLLLLGFWLYKLPPDHGSSIASNENSRGLTVPGTYSYDRPAPVFVGQVTGMAGAKWSDEPNYIAPLGVRVALGRTYKLKTGLLEITYDSGAKVILEGPCSYE
ncbi:MAG: hypothetical protein GX594_09490, partial [Pirellulaceae bacterium]|nr:hypothetical protein [Pirellulaceae bacterium]